MSVKYDFSGRRVLVTGGAKGLGKSVVLKFAYSGATVFALDNDQNGLDELKPLHPNVETICADLCNWGDCRTKVMGLAPIHHLVSNAATADKEEFMKKTEQDIDRIFGVNFKPTLNLGQAMAQGLKDNGISGGTIVNVSSLLDTRVVPAAGLYSCSKAAITTLSKFMALELASQGIRVNSVRPTFMETPFHEYKTKEVLSEMKEWTLNRQVIKRVLTPDECAEAVLFLSSDAASMIDGTELVVDGGFCTS